MPDDTECVRVVVRCRPLNKQEVSDGRGQIVEMDDGTGTCNILMANGEPPKMFTFDAVYPPNSLQETIYHQTAAPILEVPSTRRPILHTP